jgi:hypothetical protein
MTVGVHEELALVEWLAGTPDLDGMDGYLGSDSTLSGLVNGVFDDYEGSERTPLPVIRISHQDASDARPNGTDRALTTIELLIRGVSRGTDRSDARAIAARLDALLNTNQSITTPLLMVCGVSRTEPFWARDFREGDPYLWAGGIYSFAVHAL